MSDSKNNETKKTKHKEVIASKSEASLSFFLNASFFLFFLVAYSFLLFLHENNYPLIINNEILPEIMISCFCLLVFSFLSLFILSFWRLLARLFISFIAGCSVAYFFGLIYPFNVGNYFAHLLFFLPEEHLLYVAQHGNQIVMIATAFICFILLNMFKGGAMALLSMPILVAIFMLLNTSSKLTIPEIVQQKNPIEQSSDNKNQNLLYLILADHTGYANAVDHWVHLNQTAKAPLTMANSPTFIPAFYETNKFTYYPAAYLRYKDRYRNIGNVLNPSLTEISKDLFSQDDAAYYTSSPELKVSINENRLFDDLKKEGYSLNIYQTYPFNFCKGKAAKDISFCATYPAPLGGLYNTNLSTSNRVLLLMGHWFASTPTGKETTKKLQKYLADKIDTKNIPFMGNPLSASMPIGQADVLVKLRQDMIKNKGKNAYFAHINLPHYPYVYDENCKLKQDPMQWLKDKPYTDKKSLGEDLNRVTAYNQQLFCTYNQIQHLMTELKSKDVLKDTTVVIHGDSGDSINVPKGIESANKSDKTIREFKENMTTIFAIYTPENKQAVRKTAACDVATLVNTELLQKKGAVCQSPDFENHTKTEENDILAWISKPLNESYFPKKDFNKDYKKWLEMGGLSFISGIETRLANKGTNTGDKVNFISPPANKITGKTDKVKPVKSDSIEFAPVPETADKTKQIESDSIEFAPAPETADGIEIEQTRKETIEVIAEDLNKLPEPIVLPEIDEEFAQDKWKTLETPLPVKDAIIVEPKVETKKTIEIKQVADEEIEVKIETQETLQPTPVTLEKPKAAPVEPVKVTVEVKKAEQTKAETIQKTVEPVKVTIEVKEPETVKAEPIKLEPVKPEPTKVETTQKTVEPVNVAIKVNTPEPEKVTVKVKEAKPVITPIEQAKLDAIAKAEAEAKTRLEEIEKEKQAAIAKAMADAEAKIKAEAEAKEKARLAAIAKAKADAEAKIKAEAEAKENARLAAIEKIKAEVAERARIRAEEARKKAEEEQRKAEQERLKAEAEAKEKARLEAIKKQAEEEKLNKADIVKETIVEKVNDYGDVETFIFIERTPNPNRFKETKKIQEREMGQDLTHLSKEVPKDISTLPETETTDKQPVMDTPVPETKEQAPITDTPVTESKAQETTAPMPVTENVAPMPVERVLED